VVARAGVWPLAEAIAVICTGFCPGSVVGAVYQPVDVIVPAEVLPPTTPPADHVIVPLLRPLTLAVNCTELPATTEGKLGEIVTVAASSELAEVARKAIRISTGEANLRILRKLLPFDGSPAVFRT